MLPPLHAAATACCRHCTLRTSPTPSLEPPHATAALSAVACCVEGRPSGMYWVEALRVAVSRCCRRWQVGSGKTKVILPLLCQTFLSNNAEAHAAFARGGKAKVTRGSEPTRPQPCKNEPSYSFRHVEPIPRMTQLRMVSTDWDQLLPAVARARHPGPRASRPRRESPGGYSLLPAT